MSRSRAIAFVFFTILSVGPAVAESVLSDYERCVEQRLIGEVDRFVGKSISEYVDGVIEACRPTLMHYNKLNPEMYKIDELDSVEKRVRGVIKLEFISIVLRAYEKK